MTRQELIELCLTYAQVYEDYPFDPAPDAKNAWTVMRHRGSKKGFAFIFERGGLCVNLKCEPMRADFLRQALPGVSPAYHMNKTHWNTVCVGQVSAEELKDMLTISYRLTE